MCPHALLLQARSQLFSTKKTAKILSDSSLEGLIFKSILGGMPPDPPKLAC